MFPSNFPGEKIALAHDKKLSNYVKKLVQIYMILGSLA